MQVIEKLSPGEVPVVLKKYGLVPRDITVHAATAMAQQESQFMEALPKAVVVIDVSGVRAGKAFWRYARALSKSPKWTLPYRTHVVNCPNWTVKAWKQVQKIITKTDADNVSLHTSGIDEVMKAIRAANTL